MKKNSLSLAINGGTPVRNKMLPLHNVTLNEDDFEELSKVMESGILSGDGPKCREFEQRLSDYLGVKHVFFTTSCTAALDLTYMALDFPPGSEILIPDYTYTSTALAPLMNKLKVKLVDVDPSTGNIDVNQLEQQITPATVAIGSVDYAGSPADISSLASIASKHGLSIIHDSAQSIGSKWKGKYVGGYGDVTCFSFHGTKNLSIGEAGALVTNSDQIAENVVIMRSIGTQKHNFKSSDNGHYDYVSKGNSYIQSNVLGALGLSQLRKLDWMNGQRKAIAKYYLDELSGNPNISLPTQEEFGETNWHIFYILVPSKMREWCIEAMKAEGIMVNSHYIPLHLTSYYNSNTYFDDNNLHGAIEFSKSIIRIPIYPLMTEQDAKDVVTTINKILN